MQTATEMQLVGTRPIEEIIHTATLTPFVHNSIPVSIILISESGAGKSKTVLRFQGEHIMRVDDLTSKGLFDILRADPQNKIRFLLIPDFNPVLSHKASVSNLLIANLLTVSSEGLVNISDGRDAKELKHAPCGIITAVTTQMFLRSQRKWSELGITRRFLPVHYGYSTRTIMQAQDEIRQQHVTSQLLKNIHISPNGAANSGAVTIPPEIGLKIEAMSQLLANNLGQYSSFEWEGKTKARVIKQGTPIYPMSPHITLQTLAKANALRQHRTEANASDLDFLAGVIDFTNMQKRVEL